MPRITKFYAHLFVRCCKGFRFSGKSMFHPPVDSGERWNSEDLITHSTLFYGVCKSQKVKDHRDIKKTQVKQKVTHFYFHSFLHVTFRAIFEPSSLNGWKRNATANSITGMSLKSDTYLVSRRHSLVVRDALCVMGLTERSLRGFVGLMRTGR